MDTAAVAPLRSPRDIQMSSFSVSTMKNPVFPFRKFKHEHRVHFETTQQIHVSIPEPSQYIEIIIYIQSMHIYIYTYTHIYVHVHIYIYVHVYIYILIDNLYMLAVDYTSFIFCMIIDPLS